MSHSVRRWLSTLVAVHANPQPLRLPPHQAPYLHAKDFQPLQLQIIRLPGNRKGWPFIRRAYIFHYQKCKYPMSF